MASTNHQATATCVTASTAGTCAADEWQSLSECLCRQTRLPLRSTNDRSRFAVSSIGLTMHSTLGVKLRTHDNATLACNLNSRRLLHPLLSPPVRIGLTSTMSRELRRNGKPRRFVNIPRPSAKLTRNPVVNRAGSRRFGATTPRQCARNVKRGASLSK